MATTKKTNSNADVTGGINIAGIPVIEQDLTNYINGVINKCDLAAPVSLIQRALKGSSSEEQLVAMYENIENTMESYVRQLSQYNTVLDNMRQTYETQDKNNNFKAK